MGTRDRRGTRRESQSNAAVRTYQEMNAELFFRPASRVIRKKDLRE